LRWAGLFDECQIDELAPQLQSGLQPANPARQDIVTVPGPNKTRIRAMICCPERTQKSRTQPWFLHGTEIFDYTSRCLHPSSPRPLCATQYDFGLWGRHLEPIVRYFKQNSQPLGGMDELYKHLGKAVRAKVAG
jgi:hypothetical protein